MGKRRYNLKQSLEAFLVALEKSVAATRRMRLAVDRLDGNNRLLCESANTILQKTGSMIAPCGDGKSVPIGSETV